MSGKITLYKSEIDAFLSNKELLSTFTSVKISGNQKGRIRQNVLRDLQSFEENGRSNSQLIFSKIQGILNGYDKDAGALSESDQRKLKILHNFLIAAAKKVENPVKKEDKSETEETTKRGENKKEKPKRYILFVGNLPTTVTSDEIKGHFKDVPGIVSVRIQKEEDEKLKQNETKQKKKDKQLSRMFAHVELNDEFSYKLALTKHHTMLRNRRINILYSRDKTKIDKKTLKKKSLKVQFLNQSVGMSANKKRGLRRKKQQEAIRQAENA